MADTRKDTPGLYAKTTPVRRDRQERLASLHNRREAERCASRYGLKRMVQDALDVEGDEHAA